MRALIIYPPTQLDFAVCRRVLDGVGQQVRYDRVQLGLRAEQQRIRFQGHANVSWTLFQLQRFLAQQREQTADVDRLILPRRIVGLELRQLEQVIDDHVHAFCLTTHLEHRLFPSRIELLLLRERVEITADNGERRAQL